MPNMPQRENRTGIVNIGVHEGRSSKTKFTIDYAKDVDVVEIHFTVNILIDKKLDFMEMEVSPYTPHGIVGPAGSRISLKAKNIEAGGFFAATNINLPWAGVGEYGIIVYLDGVNRGTRGVVVEQKPAQKKR